MTSVPKQPRPPAPPLTAHHLFLPVVALWFGALFGLGSLAVRPALLEALVIQSRIDLAVPAAAPPLGITARILVALVMAAVGSTIGIVLGRQLARRRPEPSQRRRQPSKTRHEQPIRPSYPAATTAAAVADDGEALLAQRRRALAIEPEETMFMPAETAPLPGGSPQILDIAAMSLRAEATDGPLDLGAFAPPAAPPQPEPVPPVAAPAASEPQQPAVAPDRQVFGMAPPFAPPPPQPAAPAAPAFAMPAPSPIAPAPSFVPDPVAMQPAQAFAPAAPLPHAEPAAAPEPASGEISDLTARLAESMARRRAARAGAVSAPAAPVMPTAAPAPPLSFAPPAIPPTPVPQGFGEPVLPPAPAAMPAAMRPLPLDGLDDEGEPLDHLLPPRRMAQPETPPSVAALSPEPAGDSAVPEDDYGSLLGMAPPAPPRPTAVRIAEPEAETAEFEPVVIFPGQMARHDLAASAASGDAPVPFRRFDAPASAGQGQPVAASEAPAVDRDEADRALRLALANLQRMSGAA